MNMTNVLHRKGRTNLVGPAIQPGPGAIPPTLIPPVREQPRSPWPTGAKVLVAILVVATFLATVGTALALNAGDNGATERQLSDRVATLAQERDDAFDAVARLDGELAIAQRQLQAAVDGNEAVVERTIELEAQIATLSEARAEAAAAADVLTATIAELDATVGDLRSELVVSSDRASVLEAALLTANRRVNDAVAERDTLARLFPMSFDASLVDASMVGRFDVDASQVHCSGLASCGKAPVIDDVTIRRTSEGWLWMTVPGVAEGGLSRTGGALHFVGTSTTAVPACAGTTRTADVTMTMFPGSFRIADSGTRTVNDIGAVITIKAAATATCPAVLAFYSAELSPA